MNGSDVITMAFKEDFQCLKRAAPRNGGCVKPHYAMPKKVRLLHEGIVKVSQHASGFVALQKRTAL